MDEKVLVIVFDEEELTKTLIETYMKEVSFPYDYVAFNEFDQALLVDSPQKKIIIVNVNKTNSQTLKFISHFSKNKNNNFIIISYDKSVDLQVNALRTGAKDFLLKPLIQSDFVNVVMKIYKNEILDIKKATRLKIYSVFSMEKGIGKTTFALNLAKEVADVSKKRVLLIDFNNSLNDLNSMLSLNIKYNSPYYINKVTQDNAKQLFSGLSRYKSSSLYIMANGVLRQSETVVLLESLPTFFEIAKRFFSYILIDTDNEQNVLNNLLLKHSTGSFFVIGSSITDIDDIKRYSEKHFLDGRFRLILNKYNAKKDEAVVSEMEKQLGRLITSKLSKNVVATSAALMENSTIKEVGPQLDIVKEFNRLAKIIIDKD